MSSPTLARHASAGRGSPSANRIGLLLSRFGPGYCLSVSDNIDPGLAAASEAAVATAQAFVGAFSARDYESLAATLNYPHVRLADGQFFTFDDPAAFIDQNHRNESRLVEENFGYSRLRELEPIQVGPDKVHLRIINDRHHPDGEVYMTFNTLWIVTLQDGHWGIRFRSSYLGLS